MAVYRSAMPAMYTDPAYHVYERYAPSPAWVPQPLPKNRILFRSLQTQPAMQRKDIHLDMYRFHGPCRNIEY